MILGIKHKYLSMLGTYQASALPTELLSAKLVFKQHMLHSAPRNRCSYVTNGGGVLAVFLFVFFSFSISKCRNLKVLNIFSNGLTS